jgi:hypothetical protein
MTTLDLITNKLFDYSGIFPPESKSIQDAIATTKDFTNTLIRKNLLASDIVIGIDQVDEIKDLSLSIALLSNELTDNQILFKNQIEKLNTLLNQGYNIKSLEMKISDLVINSKSLFDNYIQILNNLPFCVALEPDLSTHNWQETLSLFLKQIQSHDKKFSLKIRGTGPTAITNEKIAVILEIITISMTPLKATGGLHHPIILEKYNNNLGFLNLVAALRFSQILRIDLSTINEILTETNPQNFKFNDNEIIWNNIKISRDQLINAMNQIPFTIGSCSIHEPDEDLKNLFC